MPLVAVDVLCAPQLYPELTDTLILAAAAYASVGWRSAALAEYQLAHRAKAARTHCNVSTRGYLERYDGDVRAQQPHA